MSANKSANKLFFFVIHKPTWQYIKLLCSKNIQGCSKTLTYCNEEPIGEKSQTIDSHVYLDFSLIPFT